MNPAERTTLDYVYPRLYPLIPRVGEADVKLSAEDSPVERLFVADLILLYAFDLDTCFEMVARRDLPRMRVEMAGGNYAATLLLLPEIWESVQSMVAGTIVTAVPARDVLLFTGDEVPDGLAEMRRVTSRMLEKVDKPLSRAFLRWEDGTWVEHKGHAA